MIFKCFLVLDFTRAIYQRKLLEAVTNESGEGNKKRKEFLFSFSFLVHSTSIGADDESEQPVDDEFHTPPIAEEGMTTRSGKTFFHEPKH